MLVFIALKDFEGYILLSEALGERQATETSTNYEYMHRSVIVVRPNRHEVCMIAFMTQ